MSDTWTRITDPGVQSLFLIWTWTAVVVGFVGSCFSCDCCGINALGNVVRMYPETIQGLTFYRHKI